MRISLSEFEIPGDPPPEGTVLYTAIDYDINSGKELDGTVFHYYFACGYREDDGVGVLTHGSQAGDSHGGTVQWMRHHRYLMAPDREDARAVRTEFHGVESLKGPNIRLVGCVEFDTKPGIMQGFLYEGWHDGSGSWYNVDIPGAENTIVKASEEEYVFCSDNEDHNLVHVFSLTGQAWDSVAVGYADPWEIEEVICAGDIYVIRLLHEDGRKSDVVYNVKK